MAKTTIDLGYSYKNKKGLSVTVDKALAWFREEDEETGEVSEMPPEEMICRYYFREKALADDRKRVKQGKLARHLYAPRLEHVEHAPKPLVQAVEAIDATQAKLDKPEKKPARRNGKKS